jgi:importin subunit alpha-1
VIRAQVDSGLIPPLCEMLASNEPKIVTVALEGLDNILRHGSRLDAPVNPYAELVIQIDGVSKLEAMNL